MSDMFFKWPKISHFKSARRELQRLSNAGQLMNGLGENVRQMTFIGSVKLHGTNAAIGYDVATDTMWAQSRNKVLSADSDNCGFFAWFQQPEIQTYFKEWFSDWVGLGKVFERFITYGEWCGGNIQKKVALSKLPKQFVSFGTRALFQNKGEWTASPLEKAPLLGPHEGISDVNRVPNYLVTVDLDNIAAAQEELVRFTEEVEAECPFAKRQGISGIGEGIVWQPLWSSDNTDLWFKTKGKKHSSSHVRAIAAPDPERDNNVAAFVEGTVTPRRLEQGLEYLREMDLELDRSSTGEFLSFVGGDIKAEESDRLEASNLTWRNVGKAVGLKARTFFFQQCDLTS